MKLTISVKQLGKKQPILKDKDIEIATLQVFLSVKEWYIILKYKNNPDASIISDIPCSDFFKFLFMP